ncbi:MAG: hypothetical protein ABSB96_09130 [Gaiellaceae bacterium]
MKMKTRWLCYLLVLGLAIGVALLAASAGAEAVKPTVKPGWQLHSSPALPHYTAYIYKAKVSVKGGTTLSNAYSGTGSVGDVQHESSTGSFSVDGTIPSLVFYVGTVPRGVPRTLNSGAPAVVNGTWSDQGEKWLDPVHGTTEPFTCGGTIVSTAPPGNLSYKATTNASNIKFTLLTQIVQLTNKPPESCPNGSRAASLGGIERDVYETQFSIPKSKIGQKTIFANFSGPLAKYRSYLAVVCGGNASGCTYNMAWHGVMRLTRVHVFKVG